MRVTVWALASVVVFCGALFWLSRQIGPVGGGSLPYISYMPPGAAPMLWTTLGMFLLGVLLLCRRPPAGYWFAYTVASIMPLALSALPSLYDLRAAEQDELHRWEGSDVLGHIQAAKLEWILGLILAAVLLNIAVFGYVARRSEV